MDAGVKGRKHVLWARGSKDGEREKTEESGGAFRARRFRNWRDRNRKVSVARYRALYRGRALHRCCPPRSVAGCCRWLRSWLGSWTAPRPLSAP